LFLGTLACVQATRGGTPYELRVELDPQQATKLSAPPSLIVRLMGYQDLTIDPASVKWADPTASVTLHFDPPGADGGSILTTIRAQGQGSDELTASQWLSPGHLAVVVLSVQPMPPPPEVGPEAGMETAPEKPPEMPPEVTDGGDTADSDAGPDGTHVDACDDLVVTKPPPLVTCIDFCALVDQMNCDPTRRGDCARVCAGLHWEDTGSLPFGNTLVCRDKQVRTSTDPLGGKCGAAFWDGAVCGPSCQVYCDALTASCPGMAVRQTCVTECLSFTDLPCRIEALVVAGLDAASAPEKCAQATATSCQ
jgi:hypothetical protein